MAKSTPRAWLCKHCGERVDPTMAMCWSCGHDRNGEPRQDLSADIQNELLIRPGTTSSLTEAIQDRGILSLIFFGSWIVTGFFVMIAGTEPIHNRYNVSRGPADELVIIAFYLSLFFTFMLMAHHLVYQKDDVTFGEPIHSSDLHRPWVRRWLVRGWGSVLFWFAWAWLLLNYLP